mgnify:CR=1 FL=1
MDKKEEPIPELTLKLADTHIKRLMEGTGLSRESVIDSIKARIQKDDKKSWVYNLAGLEIARQKFPFNVSPVEIDPAEQGEEIRKSVINALKEESVPKPVSSTVEYFIGRLAKQNEATPEAVITALKTEFGDNWVGYAAVQGQRALTAVARIKSHGTPDTGQQAFDRFM